MTERSRLAQSIAAGAGAFFVCVWPVLLIWRAGASGSVGDLSGIRVAGFGSVYSVVIAVVAGRLMHRALDPNRTGQQAGRLDPWGAFALGVGVFALALTAIPAIMFALLVTDEDQSLRSREWMVTLLWVAGHLGAAALAVAAARLILHPRSGSTTPPGATTRTATTGTTTTTTGTTTTTTGATSPRGSP